MLKFKINDTLIYRKREGSEWFKDGEEVRLVKYDHLSTGFMNYLVTNGVRYMWVTERELINVSEEGSELEYGVGDKVVYTNATEWGWFEEGDELTVLDTDSVGTMNYFVGKDNDEGLWVAGIDLKPSSKKDDEGDFKMISKFEKGDKVMFVGDESLCQYKYGEVLYVLDNDGAEYLPILVGKSKHSSESYFDSRWVDVSDLVLHMETSEEIIRGIDVLEEAFRKEIDVLKKSIRMSTQKDVEILKQIKEEEGASKDLTSSESILSREDVIQKARDFVKEVQEDAYKHGHDYIEGASELYNRYVTKSEFVVNKEKRTVVAIVKYRYGDRIVSRGIAKCMEEDVFNEDIGKAIALIKAYELPYMKDFFYAPQPTSVVPGMIVKCGKEAFDTAAGKEVEVLKYEGRCIRGHTGLLVDSFNPGRFDRNTWVSENEVDRIIDDSNADYNEL